VPADAVIQVERVLFRLLGVKCSWVVFLVGRKRLELNCRIFSETQKLEFDRRQKNFRRKCNNLRYLKEYQKRKHLPSSILTLSYESIRSKGN